MHCDEFGLSSVLHNANITRNENNNAYFAPTVLWTQLSLCWCPHNSYLSGTIGVHIQEVEEAAVLLVPAGQEGHLHELVHSRLLQLGIPSLLSVLKQEPASLQSMAFIILWATEGQASATEQGIQPTYWIYFKTGQYIALIPFQTFQSQRVNKPQAT